VLIRADRKAVNRQYLTYLLLGDEIQGRIQSISNGATVHHLNMKDIRELGMPPLPDHRVQDRIASILSAYDDLIENNTRRIKILEEMAQMLYREWLVHFRFPGHEKAQMVDSELGPIPEGWSVKRVGDVLRRHPSGNVYTESDLASSGGVPVVDQARHEFLGFHDGAPDHIATPERPIAVFGDHTCKMRLMIAPFSVGPNVVPFTTKLVVPTAYVFFLVRDLVSTHEYKRHWTELTNKVVVVSAASLADRFSELVTPSLRLIETLMRQNLNLRSQRDLLLPKLISGEVSVENIEVEAMA
jgi:type I restriction enzyme S subunit